MKNLTVLFCIIFFSNLLLAQQNSTLEVKNALESIRAINGNSGVWLPGKSINKTITGSQYLFSNWVGNFNITTKKGQKFQLFNLNYNLNTKKIESFVENDSVFQYDLDQFESINYAKNKYKVINNEQMQGVFLEIADGAKVKLLKEFTIQVQYGTLNPLTQEKISEDTYVQHHNYYIQTAGDFQKIKPNRKSILNFLSDKHNEIKTFVKQNNLSFNDDASLSKILNYYNSL